MNRFTKVLVQVLCLALASMGATVIHAQDAGKTTQEPAKTKADTKEEDCGCDAKPPADVAAVVNSVKITFKEIDEPVKTRIDEIDKQVVESRKQELARQINAKLLQNEAKRRGISVERLEQEITARAVAPTEADAQAYFNQNKDQMQGSFEDTKESILGYLRSQRRQDELNKAAQRLASAWKVLVHTQNPAPPKTEQERAQVLATVNGSPITSGDVDDAMRPLVFDARLQIYNLRKQSLDAKVNTQLLQQEAQKRKSTPEAVFEAEVTPLIRPIKEQDARKFYEENRERIQGAYVQVRQQVVEYLESQEQQRAQGEFAEKLRSGAKIQNYLTEPEQPFYSISIEDRPWRGNPNAPVTVIEFTDFQCPSCGRTQPILEQVVNEMGDKVKLVVRNFPLDQHVNAQKAAEAAEAARAQGKYFEYASLLFQNQTALEVDKLKQYATQIGLDRAKFDAALDSGQYADIVKRDVTEGVRVGVGSTPSIFVNGRKISDRTAEGLKASIESALKNVASKDSGKK